MSSFFERVAELMHERDTALVLGIDPHPADLPTLTGQAALAWSLDLLAKAGPFAVAVKPNAAFFEALPGGTEALAKLVEACDLPVLLDVKRGDIGSTAEAQARACYDLLGVDAVTIQPWLGEDAVAPFLREDKATFVLCHTSNPSAPSVQHLGTLEGPAYLAIARRALSWGSEVGLVVGATAPEALAAVRSAHPGCWILAPGVGAQGADAADTLRLGARADGFGLLVPISRGISRADDPAAAAESFARALALRSTELSTVDPLLQGLVDLECIRYGTFTLRSGETSNVYIDCRRIIGDPRLLGSLAARMVPSLRDAPLVAGVPTAGMPLGTALSLIAGVPMVYPRSTVKAHGTGRSVEGVWSAGQEVVMVDDVATAGTSLVEAAETLRAAGLVVRRALVIVDREAGATERLAAEGIELVSLFRLADVLELAP